MILLVYIVSISWTCLMGKADGPVFLLVDKLTLLLWSLLLLSWTLLCWEEEKFWTSENQGPWTLLIITSYLLSNYLLTNIFTVSWKKCRKPTFVLIILNDDLFLFSKKINRSLGSSKVVHVGLVLILIIKII